MVSGCVRNEPIEFHAKHHAWTFHSPLDVGPGCMGAAEVLNPDCLVQKSPIIPTLFRTTPSILVLC